MKKGLGAITTIASVVLAVFHGYALWFLAATFAAGLVWWASLLVLLGPPTTVAALVIALKSPRQPAAALINAGIFVFYLLLWIPLLPRLEWAPKV